MEWLFTIGIFIFFAVVSSSNKKKSDKYKKVQFDFKPKGANQKLYNESIQKPTIQKPDSLSKLFDNISNEIQSNHKKYYQNTKPINPRYISKSTSSIQQSNKRKFKELTPNMPFKPNEQDSSVTKQTKKLEELINQPIEKSQIGNFKPESKEFLKLNPEKIIEAFVFREIFADPPSKKYFNRINNLNNSEND